MIDASLSRARFLQSSRDRNGNQETHRRCRVDHPGRQPGTDSGSHRPSRSADGLQGADQDRRSGPLRDHEGENDPQGRVTTFLERHGNSIEIVETNTGAGFKVRRARDPNTPSRNLGDDAVSEYARQVARTGGPYFVPLVLFEDPDVLNLPVARLANVHLLNTAGWLDALKADGILPDAEAVIDQINAERRTPMRPYDQPARTKKLRSTFLRKSRDDAE